MKLNLIFSGMTILTLMSACKCTQAPQGDTSKNSLDWAGVYSGVLPCASCPGIQTVVQLNSDLTYRFEAAYIDGEGSPMVKEGSFVWNEQGNEVALSGFQAGEGSNRFQVGENQLIQLDVDGNKITGELADQYKLAKSNELAERYWKLVEINGMPITAAEMEGEAHLVFKAFDGRFYGNTGCNSFFGQYEISDGQNIAFSQAGSTRMMCANMAVEDQMLQLFGQTIVYELNNTQLLLKDSTGKEVAKFELGKMK